MFRLRFLLVAVACSCAVARNMERREEHHHSLSVGDNSTVHRHGNSTHPITDSATRQFWLSDHRDKPTVEQRRTIETTTASNKSDDVVIEDFSWMIKKLQKELNSLVTTTPHPKKRAADLIVERGAEPGCCG